MTMRQPLASPPSLQRYRLQLSLPGMIAIGLCLVLVAGCGDKTKDSSTSGKTGKIDIPEPEDKTKTKSEDRSTTIKNAIAEAIKQLNANNPDGAMKEVQKVLLLDGTNDEALFIAARVRAAQNRIDDAVQVLDQIPSDSPGYLPALGQSAQWLAEAGDLSAAERRLKDLIAKEPRSIEARRLLIRLFNAQGRRWESRTHLYALVQLGDFSMDEVSMLVDFAEPFGEPKLFEAAVRFSPSDTYVQLAAVRSLLYKNRFLDAEPKLKSMHQRNPERLEIWIWHGFALASLEKVDELPEWLSKAPEGFAKHPQYWMTRGKWAEVIENSELAARCYAEAIRVDNRHLGAHNRLAEQLIALNLVEQGEMFRLRAAKIAEMASLSQDTIRKSAPPDAKSRMIKGYLELGDPYLSMAWKLIDATQQSASQETLAKLQQELTELNKQRPKLDGTPLLASLPLDSWKLEDNPTASNVITKVAAVDSKVGFSDQAANLGLDAPYDNGADMSKPGLLIFEGNGGGAGVLDYDLDGFPDIYFSDAGGKPGVQDGNHAKRLYRSVDGMKFQRVEQLASLLDIGYGHGIGVGDIDQDGFPDLLVGNFGWSHLYRNQGDGTFAEWMIPQPKSDEAWTSSVAIADIDGDFLPELVIATYISGEDCKTRICGTPGTEAKNCPPNEFPPCPDRILVNQGDGSWLLADSDLLKSINNGRTLGVLVTNLDGKNGNEVYLSNDVSANHLLQSGPKDSAGKWTLTEQAGVRGVALDAFGRAQASMGIACGDVDRNGLLDMITTNFLNDVTTLYLQSTPGQFKDGTRRARLHLFAAEMLGFGCQLADVDNDGWLDLVVVNGHIDDYSKIGVPFKMVPQFLHNEKGMFHWQKTNSPGPYFDQPALGRGLATLDFNNDHRVDLLATHLDRPAALLRNDTTNDNHFFELELVGVKCDREAIGAVVTLESGSERWVTAVTAGDGYVCSSQRLLHIGIGHQESVDRLTIQWPNGDAETFEKLPIDQRLLVVQGQEPTKR